MIKHRRRKREKKRNKNTKQGRERPQVFGKSEEGYKERVQGSRKEGGEKRKTRSAGGGNSFIQKAVRGAYRGKAEKVGKRNV